MRTAAPSAWTRPSHISLHLFARTYAAQAPPRALAFHIGDTTLSFPLPPSEAARLSTALTGVMQTFADKQKAERPKRWPALEYVFMGEGGGPEVKKVRKPLSLGLLPIFAPPLCTTATADLSSPHHLRPAPAGDPAAREIEHLEVFCNPNAHATAFDARALITLRTADGLRITTEGKLTGIKADVEEFLTAPQ